MTQLQQTIDRFHEDHQEQPRLHMGASSLGHTCSRWLWLSFRWAVVEQFDGRMLRLFRRGHMEERTIIQDLRNIGYHVTNTQTKVNFGALVSGSIDGQMMIDGVNHLLEFKTHSKKSFDDVEKNGVEKSKPMHYAQMQVYMHGCELKKGLYVAVCKDDDRMYFETVDYNADVATHYIERGRSIALNPELPLPISENPTWYECKMCAAHDFCHGSKTIKKDRVNCRTCAFSTNTENGFICERFGGELIPDAHQRTGCDSHVLHHQLVNLEAKPHPSDEWKVIFMVKSKEVVNPDYKSGEILANPELCADPDQMTQMLRRDFGGEIV